MSNTQRFKRPRALIAGSALVALAASAAALPQAAQAAPEGEACVLQELPMPKGLYFSVVTGMSTEGSVIAYRAYPAGLEGDERYPYLYEDGEATPVPIPGADQILTDVNEDGLAVGAGWVDGVQRPYAFEDGQLRELASSDGGAATGVNDDGVIVGISGQGPIVPVKWLPGQVEPVELPLPKGATEGGARGIDGDGTIVGSYDDGAGTSVPYVWHPDGSGEELPLPEGVDPATVVAFYPNAVAGEWAVGYLLTQDSENAVRWNLEDGTAEVLKLSYAEGINEDGLVAGTVDPRAAVATGDGTVTYLPGLVDPAANWFGDMAADVSGDGELLAGQVFAGEDEYGYHVLKAVTWDCD
ncbi:hypothetical protein SAMN05216298_3925 [Glycomyces sambucus]|uniref:Extracellular repeat, HAF family n=1 Tax=Glycomyces sambucus TaxID=380244 RepID=A0A1G9K8L2_9ACTN|nr:hypothetical protein [Glycomyces sambucus]SDL46250.1 hypothetical protein SAMN05216298_3925 [Glycomyces sambucus]